MRRTIWQETFRIFLLGCTSPESVGAAMPAFMRWCPLTWVPDWRDEVEDTGEKVPEGWPSAPIGVTLARVSAAGRNFAAPRGARS
jgi:hypothetical protein